MVFLFLQGDSKERPFADTTSQEEKSWSKISIEHGMSRGGERTADKGCNNSIRRAGYFLGFFVRFGIVAPYALQTWTHMDFVLDDWTPMSTTQREVLSLFVSVFLILCVTVVLLRLPGGNDKEGDEVLSVCAKIAVCCLLFSPMVVFAAGDAFRDIPVAGKHFGRFEILDVPRILVPLSSAALRSNTFSGKATIEPVPGEVCNGKKVYRFFMSGNEYHFLYGGGGKVIGRTRDEKRE